MTPRFITLDGIDGTGKSTQCRLLADWLRGRGVDVVTCRDPGGTPLGDALRSILLEQRIDRTATAEAMLFMASRAELVARVIRPALDRGAWVISDRYLLATVVYQGYGGSLNPDDLWAVGRVATGGTEPDLTLVLDLPVDAAVARRGRSPDRIEERDRAFHERVRRGFLKEAARKGNIIQVVDATPEIAAIHAAIRTAVEPLFG
ncbi:MAG: dTMP kinase [Gemmataceae bacterium]